jgi:hypothetical protein
MIKTVEYKGLCSHLNGMPPLEWNGGFAPIAECVAHHKKWVYNFKTKRWNVFK